MTDQPLSGRIALVTGGGRGMGRAIALGLARAGAAGIAVASGRSPEETRAVAAEIDAIAGRPCGLALQADVGDPDACARAVADTADRFGGLGILVNNAGKGMKGVRGPRHCPFWENDDDGWLDVISTNVNGPYLMTKPAARHLIAAGHGRVINISKTLDSMLQAKNAPYGPSKAALEAMTLIMAQDFEGTGVTVNSLAPGGLVNTTFSPDGVVARRKEQGGDVVEPEAIVPPAIWLCSDAGAHYTGCRFNAVHWEPSLPGSEAAEGAREPPIFRPPRRTGIADAWTPTGQHPAL